MRVGFFRKYASKHIFVYSADATCWRLHYLFRPFHKAAGSKATIVAALKYYIGDDTRPTVAFLQWQGVARLIIS